MEWEGDEGNAPAPAWRYNLGSTWQKHHSGSHNESCNWVPLAIFRIQNVWSILVLATGPWNPPAVLGLSSGSVRFGSRPGENPNRLCLGRCVTWTGNRTVGIWPGWNQTNVPNIRFLQLWLQLSIWVLIISCHGQYLNCSSFAARSPPAFKYAIRPILFESLCNQETFHGTLAGSWSQLNEYLSHPKSESARWQSDQNGTIYTLITVRYNQNSNT